MFVDSHCHLDCLKLDKYEGDLSKALQYAMNNQVSHFLCVNIDWEHRQEVLSIAEEYSCVYASIGVHPTTQEGFEPSVSDLVLACQHPKIVAVGETGLDYFHVPAATSWQIDRFRRHIQAAIETQKPLIVHTRDAREDTIRILKEEKADLVGGVMHCFTETWDMALQAINLGFYISFSGIVTFKNAKELQEVAKRVPLERMLIETDSPYLAPVPFRGKSNEPAYVRYVAESIADLREISVEEVALATTSNYFNLFKIKR